MRHEIQRRQIRALRGDPVFRETDGGSSGEEVLHGSDVGVEGWGFHKISVRIV